MSKSVNKETAIVVARRDGTVVAQNQAAVQRLGPANAGPCWAVVGRLGRAMPCRPGCVGRLLGSEETVSTATSRVRLRCAPAGDLAVVTLESLPTLEEWEHITPRELEVLRLLADGLTAPEIAATLGVSRSTARTHIEHLRMRLGVSTQAGLVAKAIRLSLLG